MDPMDDPLDLRATRAEILLKRAQTREALAMARKLSIESRFHPLTLLAAAFGAGVAATGAIAGLILLVFRLFGLI